MLWKYNSNHTAPLFEALSLKRTMGELEQLLPTEWKQTALVCGNELVLKYQAALEAIRIAQAHQIEILGLEQFELREDGLATVSYTG